MFTTSSYDVFNNNSCAHTQQYKIQVSICSIALLNSTQKSSNMNVKELIASKLEQRKKITEYHLTTKKAQASVLRSIPTLTVTLLLDQVVFMGTDTIINSLNPELKDQLEKIVGNAAKSEMFKTTEEKILPPLFAPIAELSSKLLQSQLLLYLSLLGFSTGGYRFCFNNFVVISVFIILHAILIHVIPRTLDSEEEPEFWPEGFSWKSYKGPSYAKDNVNLAILESILSHYGHNKETYHENELVRRTRTSG